jgi:Adenosine deaminase
VSRIEQFIRTVPKAELHMHLGGSLEPEMLFRMAERNSVACGGPRKKLLLSITNSQTPGTFLLFISRAVEFS